MYEASSLAGNPISEIPSRDISTACACRSWCGANRRRTPATWTFDDGDATGHHTNNFDYVVVPITGGRFEITEDDGSARELVQDPAIPYLGHVGTSHNVVNRSGREASFVEIELKVVRL